MCVGGGARDLFHPFAFFFRLLYSHTPIHLYTCACLRKGIVISLLLPTSAAAYTGTHVVVVVVFSSSSFFFFCEMNRELLANSHKLKQITFSLGLLIGLLVFLFFLFPVHHQVVIPTPHSTTHYQAYLATDTDKKMSATAKTLADYKAPYPEPTADQKRYVIFLDPKGDNEELNEYKIQLIPGRMEAVDGANHHRIGGKIEEKNIEGWGYNYYVVTMGPTMGTLMMPFGEAAEKKPRFVAMHSDELLRYNSKLPLVVYVPKNAELRYNIWTVSSGGEGIAATTA